MAHIRLTGPDSLDGATALIKQNLRDRCLHNDILWRDIRHGERAGRMLVCELSRRRNFYEDGYPATVTLLLLEREEGVLVEAMSAETVSAELHTNRFVAELTRFLTGIGYRPVGPVPPYIPAAPSAFAEYMIDMGTYLTLDMAGSGKIDEVFTSVIRRFMPAYAPPPDTDDPFYAYRKTPIQGRGAAGSAARTANPPYTAPPAGEIEAHLRHLLETVVDAPSGEDTLIQGVDYASDANLNSKYYSLQGLAAHNLPGGAMRSCVIQCGDPLGIALLLTAAEGRIAATLSTVGGLWGARGHQHIMLAMAYRCLLDLGFTITCPGEE